MPIILNQPSGKKSVRTFVYSIYHYKMIKQFVLKSVCQLVDLDGLLVTNSYSCGAVVYKTVYNKGNTH